MTTAASISPPSPPTGSELLSSSSSSPPHAASPRARTADEGEHGQALRHGGDHASDYGRGRRVQRFAREAEHPLADDVALDLVGAGPDRARPGSRATTAARRRRRGCRRRRATAAAPARRTAIAVSCRRLLISLHHSLLMLPTGPGSSPLAVREIERQLWSWNMPHLHERLREPRREPRVVERAALAARAATARRRAASGSRAGAGSRPARA